MTKQADYKMPWRSEELNDIIGDNIYHDRLEAKKIGTPPDEEELETLLLDLVYNAEGRLPTVKHKMVEEAKAAIIAYADRLADERVRVTAALEMKQLADFIKDNHLYDQDAAMKLSYYIGKRMLELQNPQAGVEGSYTKKDP